MIIIGFIKFDLTWKYIQTEAHHFSVTEGHPEPDHADRQPSHQPQRRDARHVQHFQGHRRQGSPPADPECLPELSWDFQPWEDQQHRLQSWGRIHGPRKQ